MSEFFSRPVLKAGHKSGEGGGPDGSYFSYVRLLNFFSTFLRGVGEIISSCGFATELCSHCSETVNEHLKNRRK